MTKCIHFYAQHVNYELIDGRRRAVGMCTALLEATSSDKISQLDLLANKPSRLSDIKLAPFDTRGLFMAASVQLLNEQDYDTKRKLESLVKLLCR